MAVTSYEKDGKTLWQIYVNLRSKINPTVRVQKLTTGFQSESKALSEERKLLVELTQKVARLESQGANWEEVIDKWEYDRKTYPTGKYVEATIMDHAALLRNWTKPWIGRPASELNRGDGREILRRAESDGKPIAFQKKLKNTINVIYTWGIEERLISGVHQSPVFGLEISKEKEDSFPEILTLVEIQKLLDEGHRQAHPWFPVWTVALLTGMRSGELHSLRWTDVEMVDVEEANRQENLPALDRRYGLIRVTKTWSTRVKKEGPTKGGYWRTVPISGELFWFLLKQKERTGNTEHVLPRSWRWDQGAQAEILRSFCIGNGLKSVKFHTLRACFATQLISSGVAPTRVMKVGGWKDIKTMQRYIRMAGIDEAGVTEGLKFLPSDEAVMGHVVNLFQFKARKE